MKMPDAMATLVGLVLWITRRRYAVEVVADAQTLTRQRRERREAMARGGKH